MISALLSVALGILLSYLGLLFIMPYPPRFYLPGILVSLLNPPAPAGAHDWLSTRSNTENLDPSLNLTYSDLPNIILIIADDLGSNDLSGGIGVSTPHIDSIREHGVNFIQSYAGHATCAPSRAAIMTGRYATRFGYEFTPIPKRMAFALTKPERNMLHRPILYEDAISKVPYVRDMYVPTNETFLSDMLKRADYTTYMLGKWHLGESPGARPSDKGFDYNAVFLPGASLYLPFNHPDVINAPVGGALDDFLIANLEFAVTDSAGHKFTPDSYMTDFLSDEAARAIKQHASHVTTSIKPFFIKLSYNAPHNPLQALRSDYESEAVRHISNHTHRVYAAMIKALDRGVGKVLQALEDADVSENTLVIFTSDNGGAHYLGLHDLNSPFRGWKATLFEGGLRVPLYMQWPAKINAGTIYDKMVGHVDIFATALAAAGLSSSTTLDGVNLMPFISSDNCNNGNGNDSHGTKGEEGPVECYQNNSPHSDLYWRSGHNKAIRSSAMKLQVSVRPPKLWLFNLTEDPGESHNIVEHLEPSLVDSLCEVRGDMTTKMFCDMIKRLNEIDSAQATPLWPALIEVPIAIDRTSHDPPTVGEEYIFWAN